MNDIYFNVALNGIYLFRTETVSDSRHAQRIQDALVRKFTVKEGYSVTRYESPWQTWDITEVAR
jgi:hypothetical protein